MRAPGFLAHIDKLPTSLWPSPASPLDLHSDGYILSTGEEPAKSTEDARGAFTRSPAHNTPQPRFAFEQRRAITMAAYSRALLVVVQSVAYQLASTPPNATPPAARFDGAHPWYIRIAPTVMKVRTIRNISPSPPNAHGGSK